MVDYVTYCGKSNVGYGMDINEDYILFNDKNFDDNLLVVIADGAGSKGDTFRPSAIAVHQVETFLKRAYKHDPDLFMEYTTFFLEESFYSANDVLIGFKLGDEQNRLQYATSMTAAFITREGIMTIAHAGNTRLYVVKPSAILQVTEDHTLGWKKVKEEEITEDNYYTAIERLELYNGIGISSNPIIETKRVRLLQNDIVVMTTDGIHYSYQKEAFFEILINNQTIEGAVDQMIKTALDLRNYSDNISVNVIWYHGNE